jgi:RNA polymerase sigma-70 factor (ECF subfamily)
VSEAFNKEALAHAEALHRFAMRLCRNPHDAEDLLQETFLSAFRSFHQYKQGTNCKSWLFRIMHNGFRKKFRKKESQVTHVAIEQEGGDYILHKHLMENEKTYQDNPEKRLLDLIPSEKMQKALGALSEEYRSVLLLCDVEGLSYKEVADIMDIPVGTVRSRLSRARGTVQRRLTLDLAN